MKLTGKFFLVNFSIGFMCYFGATFGAIEYDFIDLGEEFHPEAINNQTQIAGSLFISTPFWPKRPMAAAWDQNLGMIILQSDDEYSTTFSQGINNLGQVVGWSQNPLVKYEHHAQPVFWRSIGDPLQRLIYRTYYAYATAINDSSMVVGRSTLNGRENIHHAFIWHENSGVIDLHPVGNDGYSEARGINNLGQVVGLIYCLNRNNVFSWTADKGMRIIDTPGINAFALDVNDSGTIIGTYHKQNESYAFKISVNDRFEDLGLGYPIAINNSGTIVGSNNTEPLIWKSSDPTPLNQLIGRNSGWKLTQVRDINDKGEIVGIASRSDDDTICHGFLLRPKNTPIPEIDEHKTYSCIVLPLSNEKSSYPEKRFVTIAGNAINSLNAAGKVWCQPLNMIDLDRPGIKNFDERKKYEVIAIYLNNNGKEWTATDKSLLGPWTQVYATPGDTIVVSGNFLNNWNDRVDPITGEVFLWFQPTEVISQKTRQRLIEYHTGKAQ